MAKLKTIDELAVKLYSHLYREWNGQTTKEVKEEYERLSYERRRTLKEAIIWLRDQPADIKIQALLPEFYSRTWNREHSEEFEEYQIRASLEPRREIGDTACWYSAMREIRKYFSKVLPKSPNP
jgi:hypothetical protein